MKTRSLRSSSSSVLKQCVGACVNVSESMPTETGSNKKRLTQSNHLPRASKRRKIDLSPKKCESASYDTTVSHVDLKNELNETSLKSEMNYNSSGDDETKSKENINVKAKEIDSSDSECENEFDYVKMREENMKANQEFFASLGMDEAKQLLQQSASKKSQNQYSATKRGLKIKKEPPEPTVRRQSLRIRRIDSDGVALPEPVPVATYETRSEVRIPVGPATMTDCLFTKAENVTEEDVKYFSTLICEQKSGQSNSTLCSTSSLSKLFDNISLSEENVAKVVPGRVFSVTWHPSSSCLMTAAGDKYGHIGLWNLGESDKDKNNVIVYRPHIKPISHIHFELGGHKLYSCSYDATLRCGDFEKGIFDDVFSVPEEDDDLLRNFDFIDNGNTMLVSHFRGLVSLVDTRTPGNSAEKSFDICRRSLRTVSLHPVNRHLFVTAGVEAKINLWDLRKMSKAPKPLQTLSHHTKAIASAYFSPNGNKLLSSSADDTIAVCSFNDSQLKLSKTIRHNNHTGRWLTSFRPTWHPVVEDVFITGSMRRPREIEVYDASGTLIKSFQDENLGSVCSLNAFHPNVDCAIVGANSSGRLHVFK